MNVFQKGKGEKSMKPLTIVIASAMVVGLVTACVATQAPIPDSQIGLTKTSVWTQPTPKPFVRDGSGVHGDAAPVYGVPPLVPHDVTAYKPITPSSNMCLSCHQKGTTLAKPVANVPTTISPSHYVNGQLKAAQYDCLLCHQPAANVPNLVGNDSPMPPRM
jgi:nitrate reductase cytochrome c-type subunit